MPAQVRVELNTEGWLSCVHAPQPAAGHLTCDLEII